MISQIVERDGRRFLFLSGWEETSESEVKAVFEPAIDIVLMVLLPPAGDYYLSGSAPDTSLMAAVNHDLPNSTCACGLTSDQVQRQWLDFWAVMGLPPQNNLILYNLSAIKTRVTEILSQGRSKSSALLPIAAGLAHELYHVRHDQQKMHSWEAEARAHAAQREFMNEVAPLVGLDPEFTEIWLRQSRETERDHKKEWRVRHPDRKPTGNPEVPRR